MHNRRVIGVKVLEILFKQHTRIISLNEKVIANLNDSQRQALETELNREFGTGNIPHTATTPECIANWIDDSARMQTAA